MSTLDQTPMSRPARFGRDARHAHSIRIGDGAIAEVYGGERLPVLMRLPDLSLPSASPLAADEPPLDAATVPEADAGLLAVDAPDVAEDFGEAWAGDVLNHAPEIHKSTEEVAEAVVVPPAIGRATGGEAAVRSPIKYVRNRRGAAEPRSQRKGEAALPGWLRGIGQLASAAILAGVLLAILITLKDWNRSQGADAERAVGTTSSEPPRLDFGDAVLEPVEKLDALPGPELHPPTFLQEASGTRDMVPAAWSTPASEPAAPEQLRDERMQRAFENVVPAFSGGTSAESSLPTRYPSTGVGVVSPKSESAGGENAQGWRETLPLGAPTSFEQYRTTAPPRR